MKTMNELKGLLASINGKSYKAYKILEGVYNFDKFKLSIDYVQGDPFASASRIRIIVNNNSTGINKVLYSENHKRIALQDYLIRGFYNNIYKYSNKVFGSGKSGIISISKCGQQILERTAIIIGKKEIEARIEVGFPARGRTVLSKELEKILFDFLPTIIEKSLFYENLDHEEIINRINLVDDQEYIRKELNNKNLVAFIANGSLLPRESGVSQKPDKKGMKFVSPKSLEIEFKTKHNGIIKGMGIPKGITLIVGGGYHGKSTLLKAIELGVYNHIEGDGREFVIAENDAMKVRAEDGRVIHKNDISLFINNLPNKKNTKEFFSENASGSTSQAANIIEAIESGSTLLLIDEDTSATNFMIRDDIMQRLVSKENEPITPFIEVAKSMYEQLKISTIIVVGSSGDYFDICDNVIQMDSYEPKDVTKEAKALSSGKINERIKNNKIDITNSFNRVLKNGSVLDGPKGIKIKTFGVETISINKEEINLRLVEQLVDNEQLNSIGEIIKLSEKKHVNNKKTLREIIDDILKLVDENGLIEISTIGGGSGRLAIPRKQEIMCAYNRLRTLRLK